VGHLRQSRWQAVLGTPRPKTKDHIVPYASLQPTGHSFAQYRDSLVAWASRARELGFTAGKMEVTLSGPYNHSGLNEPDDRTTEVVAACRQAVGPDFTMMIDVHMRGQRRDLPQNRPRWKEFNLFFLETPIQLMT
jgi:L-alanine-DL-glutamate epimerase-like enolase superfamily enzyme